MRALPALLVCCALLAGCVSGLGSPGESPHTETANDSVYVVEPGERVSVTVAFDGIRELHPESADDEAINFESASFSPGPSSVAQSRPPYYEWDSPTTVDGRIEYSVAADAEPGDYPVTVTAWDDGDHDRENETTERITIRVSGESDSDVTTRTVSRGESVPVVHSFRQIRTLTVRMNDAPTDAPWDAITLNSPTLTPPQTMQEDSFPPTHYWKIATDVEATHVFGVQEDAPLGDYRITVYASRTDSGSRTDGPSRTVVIRVVENESS